MTINVMTSTADSHLLQEDTVIPIPCPCNSSLWSQLSTSGLKNKIGFNSLKIVNAHCRTDCPKNKFKTGSYLASKHSES